MRRKIGALAALLLAALPVRADMYQDGSNADPAFWARAQPHVASQAALQAVSTASYPAGVWRDDYAAGRGVPPLFFKPQAGTCAANLAVDNGGGCVDAVGGNSWLAVHPASGLDIRQFGAPVDGTSSAVAALQAARDESCRIAGQNNTLGRATLRYGPRVVIPNAGPNPGVKSDYVVDSTWFMGPCGAANYSLWITWEPGARLLCNMTGADSVCLQASFQGTPVIDTRGWLTLENMTLEYDARVLEGTVGAVHFEYNYGTNFTLLGRTLINGYRKNTIFRLGGCYNCYFESTRLFGGGVNWLYRDVSAFEFSTTAGVASITANGNAFTAADVGHYLTIENNPGAGHSQTYKITGYTSPTVVTTEKTAVETVNTAVGAPLSAGGGFDGVMGSMTAGGNTVTLDAPVATGADIGRIVYVLGAALPTRSLQGVATLRAKVSAVPTASSLTLVDPETGAAANAVNTVTGVYIVPSPGVELWAPLAGTGADTNNDIKWLGMHIEGFRGAGLVIRTGNNIRIYGAKIHARNGVYDQESSTFSAILDDNQHVQMISTAWQGMSHSGVGKAYVSGTATAVSMIDNKGILANDGVAVYAAPGGNGSVVLVHDWNIQSDGTDARTLDTMFVQTGTGSLEASGTLSAKGQLTVKRLKNNVIPPTSCVGSPSGTLWNNAGVAAFCP